MKYRVHFRSRGRYVSGVCTDVQIVKKKGTDVITSNLQVSGESLDDCKRKMASELMSLELQAGTGIETCEYDSKTGNWT